MASTYLNDLRIEEQATGENSGSWGNKVNSAFSQIAEAFSYGTKQLAADSNETFTMPDGTSDGTRSLYLKITSAGSLTATRTVTLGPNTVSKLWIIENATTGSQSITIAQGSGGTVTIPTGAVKMVYSDGAGSGAAVVDALVDLHLSGSTNLASLNVDGTVTADGLTVDGNATISVSDNSDNLTLVSTDTDANAGPNLLFKRDNNSAAGDDLMGSIVFQGEDAGNNLTDYVAFKTQIQDPTGGSEDGRLKIELMSGGTSRSLLDASGSNAIVFNEDGQALNFRVESSGDANMLFVDGTNNRVGIGTSSPSELLHVSEGSSGAGRSSDADTLFLENNGNAGITIGSSTTGTGSVRFADSGGTGRGVLFYDHSSDFMSFHSAGGERLRLDSSGRLGVNTSSPADLLHVKSSTSAVSDSQLILEGTVGGYGAGISFQSQLSGGSLAEMARITADGEAPWNTTATTQDAGLRFFTTLDGTSSQKMKLDANGNLSLLTTNIGSPGLSVTNSKNISFAESTNNTSLATLFRQSSSGDLVLGSGVAYSGTANGFSSSTGSAWARSAVNVGYGGVKFYTAAEATVSVGTDATLNERMRLNSDGELLLNATSNNAGSILHVEGPTNKHARSIDSHNDISGSNEAALMAEGTVAVDTVSSGTVLSIPIYSQASVWRRYIIQFMFSSGEYNDSANARCGTATVKFGALNSLSSVSLLDSTGAVSSVGSSGMNLQITFSSGFTGGLSNYEGVLVYYKILSSHPSYVQMWNATLN